MACGLPVWGRRGRLAPYLSRAGRQLPHARTRPGLWLWGPDTSTLWARCVGAASAGAAPAPPPRRSPLHRRAPFWGHWWRREPCLALARVTRSTGDTPVDGGELAAAGPPRPVTLPRVGVVCMIGPHGEPSTGGLVRPSPLVCVSTQWAHTAAAGGGGRAPGTHPLYPPPTHMLFCRTDQCVQLCTPIASRCEPPTWPTWHGLRAPPPPSKPLRKGWPDPPHSFPHIMAESARCGGGHYRREHAAHQQVGREGGCCAGGGTAVAGAQGVAAGAQGLPVGSRGAGSHHPARRLNGVALGKGPPTKHPERRLRDGTGGGASGRGRASWSTAAASPRNLRPPPPPQALP